MPTAFVVSYFNHKHDTHTPNHKSTNKSTVHTTSCSSKQLQAIASIGRESIQHRVVHFQVSRTQMTQYWDGRWSTLHPSVCQPICLSVSQFTTQPVILLKSYFCRLHLQWHCCSSLLLLQLCLFQQQQPQRCDAMEQLSLQLPLTFATFSLLFEKSPKKKMEQIDTWKCTNTCCYR